MLNAGSAGRKLSAHMPLLICSLQVRINIFSYNCTKLLVCALGSQGCFKDRQPDWKVNREVECRKCRAQVACTYAAAYVLITGKI